MAVRRIGSQVSTSPEHTGLDVFPVKDDVARAGRQGESTLLRRRDAMGYAKQEPSCTAGLGRRLAWKRVFHQDGNVADAAAELLRWGVVQRGEQSCP